jgi:hypothetical protein
VQTVVFETENALFYFESPDAICHLKYYSEQKVREAIELLETISSSSSEVINIESDYFGFVLLDLIKAEKGEAYCKTCKKIYYPGQLVSKQVGFGKSPFEVRHKQKGGIFRKFFGREKRICGRGGEGYLCPDGHELIRMITWTGILRIPNVKDITCF